MHKVGQLRSPKIDEMLEQDDLFIDFAAFEAKLVEFCNTRFRNPKAKELDEMVQSCRLEE